MIHLFIYYFNHTIVEPEVDSIKIPEGILGLTSVLHLKVSLSLKSHS